MISVIVPTREREQKLLRLLESIEAQDCDKNNFEVIVVNDGSHYESMTAKNRFSMRVNYFEIEGVGPAGARNFGVDNSIGDILAFIDDDCVALKQWITKIDNFFKKDGNKNFVAVGGGVKPLIHNKRIVNAYLSYIKFLDGPIENDGKITNMATANLAVRRSAFYDVGGFTKEMRHGEDENLVWKLSRNGIVKFDCNNSVLHDNDITFKQFYKKYKGYGSGVRMHCKLSGEKLKEDSVYFLYCSKKIDLIKKMNIIVSRGKKRVREGEDYKSISFFQKCFFIFLSITQEYCVQKGSII